MRSRTRRGISRRDFVRSALAIGGSQALSACLTREVSSPDSEFPTGVEDFAALPDSQHAWGAYLVRDANWNTVLPQHQVLLFLRYDGEIPPRESDREAVEAAFRSLDRAYRRGTGGEDDAVFNDGLLYTFGYARRYFDRFEEALPDSVDLRPPRAVLAELGEDPTLADPHDALLVLTSDYASILLAVEEALFGDRDTLNGVEVDGTLADSFEVAERRTGFVGKGLPEKNLDTDGIPENAPLAMGYKSGFRDNLPPEEKVTIQEGPFVGGTTQLVSKLRMKLDDWYDEDDDTRRELMFSPEHTREQVGEIGDQLAAHSGITEDLVEKTDEHARTRKCVGHTQKTARARDDDFDPVILRRSEGINTSDPEPGFNFSSVQRTIGDFVETRKQMNGAEFEGEIDREKNGIVDFIEVERRATFLIPPRGLRALPSPNPEA